MTSAAWRIARTVIETASVTSLTVTVLTSSVAVWSTRRVFTLRRENTVLRNKLRCQQIGAQWATKSKGVLREILDLEGNGGAGKTTH